VIAKRFPESPASVRRITACRCAPSQRNFIAICRPNEVGSKDTARVNSSTVTRLIVPFVGYSGRYVWHCHILEHEDNEMMRPYEILPSGSKTL
jgi:hypothetical protein